MVNILSAILRLTSSSKSISSREVSPNFRKFGSINRIEPQFSFDVKGLYNKYFIKVGHKHLISEQWMGHLGGFVRFPK